MPLFEALSQAALLNPDNDMDDDMIGDDDEDDRLIYNTEEVELGAEQVENIYYFSYLIII
jgi:hypothetical protein